jgi:predicted DsbA family dithiol-disulfide isomerase
MVRKQTEGNEEQRRAAARQARAAGISPSALQETTGASKQRAHQPRHDSHEEKQASVHQGKQGWEGLGVTTVPPAREAPRFADGQDYTPEHERVFQALTQAETNRGGAGVYLDEIAQEAGLPRQRVRELVHDLSAVQGLVSVVQGDYPDLGPRYIAKPRL